ncbi:Polyadenylate-binding protein RBP47C-like protein, partial [Drosera capensis]
MNSGFDQSNQAAVSGSGGGGEVGKAAATAQQQWMAMQYPGMVIPHHMMRPQHYAALPPPHYMAAAGYHPHGVHHHHYMQGPPPPPSPHRGGGGGGGHGQKQQRSDAAAAAAAGENKTIWVGDLLHWMDEHYLHRCFVSAGEITSIKVIRNKHTGAPEGYGFVEFDSHATAEKVLQSHAGTPMLHTPDQLYRLNWATFSTGEKRNGNGSDLSIFVGDLAPDVTDSLLHETFASKYFSVKAAKVVIDANTGRSKGYGFVRFGDENEKAQAMNEMNGVYCSSRAMRIGAATPRKSVGYQQDEICLLMYTPSSPGGHAANGSSPADADSTNTTIFVGALDPGVTDDDLRQPFSEFGDIVSVKIIRDKGCGFVQFANRSNAVEALQKLNGKVIGNQTVRLSWGRNHPASKQTRGGDFGGQWNGAYYGGHMHDGYGYAMPHLYDPNMYAVAAVAPYGAYPVYVNQQQKLPREKNPSGSEWSGTEFWPDYE